MPPCVYKGVYATLCLPVCVPWCICHPMSPCVCTLGILPYMPPYVYSEVYLSYMSPMVPVCRRVLTPRRLPRAALYPFHCWSTPQSLTGVHIYQLLVKNRGLSEARRALPRKPFPFHCWRTVGPCWVYTTRGIPPGYVPPSHPGVYTEPPASLCAVSAHERRVMAPVHHAG